MCLACVPGDNSASTFSIPLAQNAAVAPVCLCRCCCGCWVAGPRRDILTSPPWIAAPLCCFFILFYCYYYLFLQAVSPVQHCFCICSLGLILPLQLRPVPSGEEGSRCLLLFAAVKLHTDNFSNAAIRSCAWEDVLLLQLGFRGLKECCEREE